MVKALNNGADLDSALSREFLDGTLNDTDLRQADEDMTLPFADLRSREWCFDGIRVAHADWHFHEPGKIDYQSDVKNEVVTLYFNLKGKTSSFQSSAEGPEKFEMGNYQHNLFYSASASGSLESSRQQLTTFMVQFSAAAFLRLTQDANDVLKRFAGRMAQQKPLVLSKASLSLTGEMLAVIDSMLHCPYDDGLKRMFFFSKSIELLVMQAEAYNKASGDVSVTVKKEYDKEQIVYAREYLMKHLEKPPTLPELSRICGINEYKLKKGFREVFGNSVFGYVSDCRLEMGRSVLMDGTSSVTELADTLGYSSPQHFSRAFRNKFGVSPREVRRR